MLVNGSSRKKSCTDVALREVERGLNKEGIETEQFFIGNEPLPDCISCRKCREIGCCVFNDVAPVYFAHPSGRLLTFMDRAFYSGGAAFSFCSMSVVSSTYWNHVYGAQPEEVAEVNDSPSILSRFPLR